MELKKLYALNCNGEIKNLSILQKILNFLIKNKEEYQPNLIDLLLNHLKIYNIHQQTQEKLPQNDEFL